MKVLLVNQFFPPDIAPTGQMASELADDLCEAGIQVTVLASRGRYMGGTLPEWETRPGVEVRRLAATSLGKSTLLHRALDYGSFHAATAIELAWLPPHDVVVAMTTPPLIAAAGLVARRWSGSKLVYWVQDLYPEIAIAFGALKAGSAAARAMAAISRRVMSSSDRVVVLGEAMAERVVDAGAAPELVEVIPNWADGSVVRPIPHIENPLRTQFAAADRLVVMYSGNIGRAHDVETLAGAARILRDRTEIVFLFLGDGAKRVELELATRGLPNVRFDSYRPRENLAQSLSAGDVHLISLAPNVVGLVEPSKLYGIMAAGRPAVFVGPERSEAARTIVREGCGVIVRNGDPAGLAKAVGALADDTQQRATLGARGRAALESRYARNHATRRFVAMLRGLAGDESPSTYG